MEEKIHIALVVQDGMKDHLIPIATTHKDVLSSNYIISTKGTSEYLSKMAGLVVNERVASGKDGGDIKIANMVIDGAVDVLIFLLNPETVFPHGIAASALVRECDRKNIPIATNVITANIILKSLS